MRIGCHMSVAKVLQRCCAGLWTDADVVQYFPRIEVLPVRR